ncbi:MAG: aldolase/citrate lyase family protein, partial [Actinomycetota bacterium]|nr:aldolase/citrate lyase family protein [Actinomycetota bacterium]
WLAIPSVVSAEAAARVGFDYVCLDNQHGVLDYQQSVAMAQAIVLGGGTPIARVPWNEPGIIGKMLDAGIEGVIVPMVNSAAEAQAVVRAGRYPPLGARSFGPVIAGMRRADHFDWSTDGIAIIPMIETAEAVAHLAEILAVPGIDAVYVGPADLSISLGLPPGNNDGRGEFDDALQTIVAGCRKAGVVPGIHASAALIERRLEQGFRMITVTSDMLALKGSLVADLATARGARPAESKSGAMY